ncbi:hypothetical protein NM688_g6213 [Phlebia brevispora]|uniref:Uncharacterized protein n=1 Tax=Phlebia brevispora TaxID=194682 RepID=A0ACC1SIN2_9APHY|nr:hypothetical protein NM688_g6213 [Phlebia brevispora]
MTTTSRTRTRSEYRSLAALTAMSWPLSSLVRIRDGADIERFLTIMQHNHRAAPFISDLYVIPGINIPLPNRLLRSLFSSLSSVTDLRLFLPARTSASLFSGVHFSQLVLLETNLPHSRLIDFISRHSTLKILALGACGRSKQCPLGVLDLGGVTDLQCPVDCVPKLVHVHLTRLSVYIDSFSTQVSLLIPPFRLYSVTLLTMEILHDDYDILRTVITVAPLVRKLKLVEKVNSSTRWRSRREWNNHRQWAQHLRMLTALEELVIETPASLVKPVGDSKAEERLIKRWVTGKSSSKTGIRHVHPALYRVAFRYGSKDASEVVSDWYRSQDASYWYRQAHLSVVGSSSEDMSFVAL